MSSLPPIRRLVNGTALVRVPEGEGIGQHGLRVHGQGRGHRGQFSSRALAGKRDRELLRLGFAGAFRRSELWAPEVGDLTEVPDGLRVRIGRSKDDQKGQGQEVAIPRGYRLRPVEAVQAWLAAAGSAAGRCSERSPRVARSQTRRWAATARRGS